MTSSETWWIRTTPEECLNDYYEGLSELFVLGVDQHGTFKCLSLKSNGSQHCPKCINLFDNPQYMFSLLVEIEKLRMVPSNKKGKKIPKVKANNEDPQARRFREGIQHHIRRYD